MRALIILAIWLPMVLRQAIHPTGWAEMVAYCESGGPWLLDCDKVLGEPDDEGWVADSMLGNGGVWFLGATGKEKVAIRHRGWYDQVEVTFYDLFMRPLETVLVQFPQSDDYRWEVVTAPGDFAFVGIRNGGGTPNWIQVDAIGWW